MRWPVRISQPGSGGGPTPPGSSEDRFAPKYLVGNTVSGDPDTASTTGLATGFNYYPDNGTGNGIQAAMSDAAANPGDVWIRPGSYTLSNTINVPDGVEVRGAGQSVTLISSANGAISGALFNLGNGSKLRDMYVAHDQPGSKNVPLEGYGVIQVKNGGAYCENVTASSSWASPTNNTLRGVFYAFSSTTDAANLFCINCAAAYKGNTGGSYLDNLVGFRARDANLELIDCGSVNIAAVTGYGVISIASQAAVNLTIRGGTYTARYGCIYAQSSVPNCTFLCDGATTVGGADPSGGGSVGIGFAGYWNGGVSNCNVTMVSGNGAVCVGWYPTAGSENLNTGRLVGCNLTGGTTIYPWYSLLNAGVSGYHTIIGNTYQATMRAPFTGPNDEAAHNIAIP